VDGVDAQHWAVLTLDVATGAALLLGGLLLLARARAAGALLVVAAVAWFVPFLWTPAVFWHRGPLVHLMLAVPGLRPHTVPAAAVTTVAYGVSVLAPSLWLDGRATAGLGAGIVAASWWNLRHATGVDKHQRRIALRAATVVGGALVLGALLRWTLGPSAWLAALALYDGALVALAIVLVVGTAPARTSRLRDLVIDLGESREHRTRDALAQTLRDPDLVVAVWDPDRQAYVAPGGDPVPPRTAGRGTTRVDRDGQPFVLLVHDQALEDDVRLAEAVAIAARVDALNTTWQHEVERQARQLAGSRRRLVAAADDERRRLEADLERGVVTRLDELASILREVDATPGSHLARARDHLAGTRQDLEELAAGLRPRALDGGLESALRGLAASVPQDVDVRYDAGPLPDDAVLTAYFVCAEALVNVVKHAPRARAALEVAVRDCRLRVTVADDGPGGAVLVGRGGLLGLRDRVEALGGRLEVTSDASGTRVVAELPLDHRLS
jgi:signal transduction histidine kinase